MKHLFIVNPVAGNVDRTEDVRQAAKAAFTNEDDYEIYVTAGPMDAAAEVKKRGESGEQYRIYSCGGDGTFNECINGGIGFDNIAFAPFPVGTGNDFCRMFGQESELYRNLPAILAGSTRKIDAIDCNGRLSINLCSVGIDARIGCNVHKYSKIPLIGGAGGYVISAIVEMFRGIPMYMKIKCGDYESESKKTLACVCNGRYYGGGFNPCRYSLPDDGVLDIVIADKLNLLQFAGMIGKYAKGDCESLKAISVLHGEDISIEFDGEQIINLDGEAMNAEKVEMRIVKQCISLIVPEGMRFFEKNVTDNS